MSEYQPIQEKLKTFLEPRPSYSHTAIVEATLPFLDKIATKALYPDIPDRHRAEALKELTTLLDYLRDEELWISRYKSKRITGHFSSAAPRHPKIETLYDVLSAASQRELPRKFPSLWIAFTQKPYQKISHMMAPLFSRANALDMDHESHCYRNTYIDKNETINARELIAFLELSQAVIKDHSFQNRYKFGRADRLPYDFYPLSKHLEHLAHKVRRLTDDIDLHAITNWVSKDIAYNFAQSTSFSPEHIIALTRHHLMHHADRYTEIQIHGISRELSRIFSECMNLQAKSYCAGPEMRVYVNDYERRKLSIDVEKPSVEDVLNHLSEQCSNKRHSQLLENVKSQLSRTPEGMMPVVTLHTPEQDDKIRKERNAGFKNKFHGDDLGKKRLFIRGLVALHAEDLKRYYGATDDDIQHIKDELKIPEHIPLNIEHITDRKAIGVNLTYNLIAIPQDINTRKEKMVSAQLALHGEITEPAWIVTWHPQRDSFGRFPDLFIPKTVLNSPGIDIQAACTDYTPVVSMRHEPEAI